MTGQAKDQNQTPSAAPHPVGGSAKRYEVGELRPSQILHTFGIGAVVDLPEISVMVMGLDEWPTIPGQEIGEDRLLRAVQYELGQQVRALQPPPLPNEELANPAIGVPVAPFPRWMVCPYCRMLSPIDDGIFTLKTMYMRPDRTRYVHEGCRKKGAPPTVLPVRFMVACEQGHLDEFPWHYFVHRGASCTNPKGGVLRLREYGVSGEASDIFVECDGCSARRNLSEAFGQEGKRHMPACRGRHPHLREFAATPCSQQMRTILLGASNSWFGLSLSVLSVPTTADRLAQLVEEHWHVLEKAQSIQNVALIRDLGQINRLLDYPDEAIWDAIEAKRTATPQEQQPRSLKGPEWQTLTDPANAPNLPDFHISEITPPARYQPILQRVILAHRLREVRALIGFTRILSPGNFAETTEIPQDYRVPLTRTDPTWVPATQVHGEGIFLQFREEQIAAWLERPAVKAYEERFFEAHRAWRKSRRIEEPDKNYPGLRYVMLHTLSHALIRQFALECGYTAASIRERIYALPPANPEGPMAGILLYTAAPDSEGTLGGLVNLGTPDELERHLDTALEHMRHCASDPLCAEHTPQTEPHSLHGAACHACTFAAETSCERGNRYLDRSLLVPTIETQRRELAFFGA